ncbi:zinc-binding dehydrogenase [Streptomyces sp. NPDC051173]|uniref:zinc-binding dehydrogenase n=1 Tax=Streptomyces sp. NPDC051173 TaxID=3155164 RepID=UPI00344D5F50
MRAVLLHQFGPPENLQIGEVAAPAPRPGEVTVDAAAVGVQFLETQVRSGKMGGVLGGAPFPVVLGKELAGTVGAVGSPEHTHLIGKRVLASTVSTGGYAEQAVVPADSVIEIPAGLGTEDALALYRYGCTAAGLIRAARLGPGDRVLVQAAAGAVGTLLVQLLKAAGVGTVIGTARGEHKLALIKELGADHAVDYSAAGWADQVRAGLGGGTVDVVFDHIGGPVSKAAFGLLTGGSGRFVTFGFSSGSPVEIGPMDLLGRGLTLTGFTAGQVWSRPDHARELVTEVLGLAVAGRVKAVIGQRFPLAEAAAAHAAVEARTTVGKTLLIP